MFTHTVCFISIAFVQLKHRIEEQRMYSNNVTKRMNLMNDKHIEELNVGKWFSFEEERSVQISCRMPISHLMDLKKLRTSEIQLSLNINNMFFEGCYVMSILLGLVLLAISAIVRKTMTLHDLNEYPPIILRILDLSPPILWSIGLPLSIHAQHLEILKYFGRILCQ